MPATLSISTVPSDAPLDIKSGLSSPATTSITVLSKISADDCVSVSDSDDSLIICTNSDDDGVWEDGHSRVSNTEEERARAAMDYVVIYDESSEEEN
jgi:hypothetical protein